LRGRTVTLVPLDADMHADALYRGANGGEKDRAWTYLPYGPYTDAVEFKASIAAKAQLSDALFFAIVDNSTGEAVGHQAFHRIEPTHRVIEVGHILYTPRMQRTIGEISVRGLCLRRAWLSPLRMEVRRSQRALEARGGAFRVHVRGCAPPAHDNQGPQSRHRLVLDAGFGMAGAQRRLRALARSLKFRCGRPPEGVAHEPDHGIRMRHVGVWGDRHLRHLSTPTHVPSDRNPRRAEKGKTALAEGRRLNPKLSVKWVTSRYANIPAISEGQPAARGDPGRRCRGFSRLAGADEDRTLARDCGPCAAI
jgi:hypothetical protein